MATKTSSESVSTSPNGAPEPLRKKRQLRFPTAFTVLFFVLLLVWGLTFVIKPGSYAYVSCEGGAPKPIPSSYQTAKSDLSFRDRLYDLLLAPVNGLYGIRTPSDAVSTPPPDVAKAAGVGWRDVDRHTRIVFPKRRDPILREFSQHVGSRAFEML